jgi:conserved oligomeric Golgi complex subunit 6
MKKHMAAAHETTATLLSEAASVMRQRSQIETKQMLLQALRTAFLMSDEEVASLTLASEPIDERFFLALAKAKRISRDCELLLGFEKQTLGLDVMERTSKLLNQAFQKLYRWIEREFKTFNLEAPQIGSAIRRSLRVLAERPTLFQNCMDLFAGAREQVLSDAFFTALTGTSASGITDRSVKPIELVAHDPLRYVGDMLAWVHAASVGEREALEVLFVADGGELAKDIQAGRDAEVWRLAAEDGEEATTFNAAEALGDLVDRDVSGIARLLRQRVEQVIQAAEETILAYKLANLLEFYGTTFAKLLGSTSVLVETIKALDKEAMRQFRSLMREHLATLPSDIERTPAGPDPPDFFEDALELLVAIMETYDTSLAAEDSREAAFGPVLAEAFDPFLSGCETVSKGLPSPLNLIFMANCILAAKAILVPFDFVDGRVHELDRRLEELSRKATDFQYAFFRNESGLDEIFAALAPISSQEDDIKRIRDLPALQPQTLVPASQLFDDFLPSALMDAMENIKELRDPKMAEEATAEAARQFCDDFEHVEELITRVDELAQEGARDSDDHDQRLLREMFPRTSNEIRVLLA